MKKGTKAASLLAALAAGGLLRSQYEREHFVVEETRLYSPKLKTDRTLVFLTDLHDKEFGENNVRLLDAVAAVRPAGILIGGDTMVVKPGRASLEVTKTLLAGLAAIAPVYYGNGNHEQRMRREQDTYGGLYREFRRLLKRYGVRYLSDSSADLGEDIRVSGLDIAGKYYRDFKPDRMRQSYVRRHLGQASQERYQILLAHSPLFFQAYKGWGADLSLAGHFHGGTIRLPWLGGVMTPQYQFFLPCCAGTFEQDGSCLIVGRGLGTHSVDIRFCNKPQVVVLRLTNREEQDGKIR